MSQNSSFPSGARDAKTLPILSPVVCIGSVFQAALSIVSTQDLEACLISKAISGNLVLMASLGSAFSGYKIMTMPV